MMHLKWDKLPTIKKIKCVHTNAEKYRVDRVLSAEKVYEVKNETEESIISSLIIQVGLADIRKTISLK